MHFCLKMTNGPIGFRHSQQSLGSMSRFPKRRIEAGPEMDEPAQKENPKNDPRNKEKDRGEHPPLDQLTEPRNEEAGEGCNDISG
jgi:hypothetical protein